MPLCFICSQVPVNASNARDRELPGAASQSAKANLGLLLGEGEDSHANQGASLASASEGSAHLGDPDEDGNHSHYSNSTASSQCSATYSNLGKNVRWLLVYLCSSLLARSYSVYLKFSLKKMSC